MAWRGGIVEWIINNRWEPGDARGMRVNLRILRISLRSSSVTAFEQPLE